MRESARIWHCPHCSATNPINGDPCGACDRHAGTGEWPEPQPGPVATVDEPDAEPRGTTPNATTGGLDA